jgi:hypothetical protein
MIYGRIAKRKKKKKTPRYQIWDDCVDGLTLTPTQQHVKKKKQKKGEGTASVDSTL